MNRHLPALSTYDKTEPTYSERDLLYRLLFDMRRELAELKQLLFQFMGNATTANFAHSVPPALFKEYTAANNENLTMPTAQAITPYEPHLHHIAQPAVVITPRENTTTRKREDYNTAEVVEESLSVRDNEKDLIVKALQKHKNRRKDAAADLGISERTLYRKIRDFDIKE